MTLKCMRALFVFFLSHFPRLFFSLYLLCLSPHSSCIPGCAGAAGVEIATGAGAGAVAGAGAASVKMDRKNSIITTLHYKVTHILVTNLEIERILLLTLHIKTISKVDRCTCLDTCCCRCCSGHPLLLLFQKSIVRENHIPSLWQDSCQLNASTNVQVTFICMITRTYGHTPYVYEAL